MGGSCKSLPFKSHVLFMVYKCLFKGAYNAWKLVPMVFLTDLWEEFKCLQCVNSSQTPWQHEIQHAFAPLYYSLL